jgi:hypothetical protein
VETGASENLGDLHLSEWRTESLEPLNDVGHEFGKLVHRLGQPNKCIRSLLFESSHPGGDGERAHLEYPCGLGEGPATGGTKFEDRQAVRRWIMGSSEGFDLLHPGILDMELLSEELNFLPETILLRVVSQLGIQAFGRPSMGQRQGRASEGDDLNDGRADPAGPAPGKRKRARRQGMTHGCLRKGMQE